MMTINFEQHEQKIMRQHVWIHGQRRNPWAPTDREPDRDGRTDGQPQGPDEPGRRQVQRCRTWSVPTMRTRVPNSPASPVTSTATAGGTNNATDGEWPRMRPQRGYAVKTFPAFWDATCSHLAAIVERQPAAGRPPPPAMSRSMTSPARLRQLVPPAPKVRHRVQTVIYACESSLIEPRGAREK